MSCVVDFVSHVADVLGSYLFGVLYWYVWTVLLPRRGGYSLEEEAEVLDDGTSVTKLVRAYKLGSHL